MRAELTGCQDDNMSVSAALLLGLVSCCLHRSAAGAQLAPPQNVRMVTLNTQYALSWDYHSPSATFTTQYLSMYKYKKKRVTWTMACNDTSQWSCDLTVFNLHYLGIYMVRVQANADGRPSDWVQKEFCPDKNAALGPPAGVRLVPVGSDLEVTITDPRTTNNGSMKDLVPNLYYHIRYWEHSEETLASVLSSKANMVTLPLKPWTWYCVSVQSRYDFYQKSSNFTTPHCLRTEGAVPWWQIFMFFLGSLTLCFLLVVLLLYGSFFIYKTFKATLYPANRLPPHFQQFPYDSPASDIPPLLPPDSESLFYDKVLICPEPPRLWEQEVPPEDCSCQVSSSSSGDSGMDSTGMDSTGVDSTGVDSTGTDSGVDSSGGCSSIQQPVPAALGRALGSRAPEQVKMQEIKREASVADDAVSMWI